MITQTFKCNYSVSCLLTRHSSIWITNDGIHCAQSAIPISYQNLQKVGYDIAGGFLLRNSIELILKTWREKNNFDMFDKNYCWAVICYPICVSNVSYEREIIVLSFPVISFVILIFVLLRFEIKSVFPFFWLTLYTYPLSKCHFKTILKVFITFILRSINVDFVGSRSAHQCWFLMTRLQWLCLFVVCLLYVCCY